MPRRKNYRRRAKGAEDRVARQAKRRTSAKAQGKQIHSLAKSINHIKHELKDHTVPVMWENNLSQTVSLRNVVLGGALQPSYNKSSNVIVYPLTSIGDPTRGALASTSTSSTPGQAGTCSHSPVQPYGASIGDTNQAHVTAPWMKLYKQRLNVCLRQADMTIPCRYRIYVVRLARPEDGSSLDSTFLNLRKNIDGISHTGCPTSINDFKQDYDFRASDGYFPSSSGNPGAIDNLGCALAVPNTNRFKIVHSRSCVLGPMPRQVASASTNVTPQYGAVMSTPEARDYYEFNCSWSYGGVKVSAPSEGEPIETTNKEEPQSIMNVSYANLRSDILHWLLIFPDRATITNTPTNEGYGAPVMTLRSQISTRLPA